MYGVGSVIIAIVVQALWKLGVTAVKGPATALVGVLAIGLFLAGLNELVLLALGGPDGTTLFITARRSLYRVEMLVTGQ